MGNTYTRQSSYSDGDVITAAHTNDEFNQLLAAFQASSGHTHDGTANEGGPITKMLGTSLTLGDGTAGTDITVTFDGETSDGVLKWMEDEDYFEFSDDILVASTEKLQFRDTAIYINSSTDGQLDIVADTEVQIAATTIDINGNADISGNLGIGGNLTVTGTTTFNGGTMTLGDAATDNVVFGADVNSAIIPNTDNTYDLGSSSQQWKDIYINGTAYLDAIDFNGTAISSTAAELNIIDGDTTATSTTLADADRVVVNDAGTMKQVALTDFETYFESALDTLSNVTTVGALNSGSITSGFGTINTGSSTITTTGLITGGSLDIDDVLINGTTIGHTDDTDLITLANGVVTVAGELDATTLDISGNADIDGTLEADAITVNGTALNTVIAGVTVANATTAAVATTVTISDNESTNEDNAIVFTSGGDVDGGNIGLESDGDLTYNPSTGRLTATQLSGTLQTAAQANVTSLGTLTTLTVDNVIINGSTIGHTGDTDLMTVASGVLTVAGEVDATSLDISGDADIDGTLEADAITVNGTALNTVIANEATALAIALG
jgi:cytoskeletal protein CcmA (bactofilin family)